MHRIEVNVQTGEQKIVEFTPEEIAELIANVSKPTEQDYANAIQIHMDKIAQSKNYRDGFALSTYVTSSKSQWKQEAETFVLWRDAVWEHVFTELEKVKNGTRPQPTIEEIIAELPTITW